MHRNHAKDMVKGLANGTTNLPLNVQNVLNSDN